MSRQFGTGPSGKNMRSLEISTRFCAVHASSAAHSPASASRAHSAPSSACARGGGSHKGA